MALKVELLPETERLLRERAEVHHVPVEDYLRTLVESALQPGTIQAHEPNLTPEEFHRLLLELGQFSDQIPNRPGSFWTRDIVSDDDRG